MVPVRLEHSSRPKFVTPPNLEAPAAQAESSSATWCTAGAGPSQRSESSEGG